jgi:restriction system protein
MADRDATVWGIHAGKTGDADTLFLKKDCVAVGWSGVGDLGVLSADREAFKAKVAAVYPEKKSGAVANNAGQLFRFVHELKVGDVIVYPSKMDRRVHLGKITGPYRYDHDLEGGYPHLRPVRWVQAVPRTNFTQGALYEIGSAMSFFQVKTYAAEFLAALKGEIVSLPVSADPTVAQVSEVTEENTRDFILKRLSRDLKGHPMEELVAHLLQAMGYKTRLFPDGPNSSPDVIAHRDALGLEPPIIKVEVKSGDGDVDEPTVSALNGKLSGGDFGLVISLGGFTSRARHFGRGKSNLRLIDGKELVDLILENYDRFDAHYKGVLPLKKVFIPDESLEDAE